MASSTRVLQRQIAERRLHLQQHQAKLAAFHPKSQLRQFRLVFRYPPQGIVDQTVQAVARARLGLSSAAKQLHVLSPLGILQRGYSIVFDTQQHALRDSQQVAAGDLLRVRLARGELTAR
ncbi:MAG: exodeoxyribonuclease VII large subunit [Myxococcota bacterium]